MYTGKNNQQHTSTTQQLWLTWALKMSRWAHLRNEGRQLRIVKCENSEVPLPGELHDGRGVRTDVVSLNFL